MNAELSCLKSQFMRLATTTFRTLWLINLIFTCYGFIADIGGLSFYGSYPGPKYHMGAEAKAVETVIIASFGMHLMSGAFLWEGSVKTRWCSLAATALFFLYLSIPHF